MNIEKIEYNWYQVTFTSNGVKQVMYGNNRADCIDTVSKYIYAI